MNNKRTIIILITLVCYFLFILVITMIGVLDDKSIRGNNLIKERSDKTYSKLESFFSVSLNRKHSFGLDPTPNPLLPPNIEDDVEAEMTD